MPYLGDIVQTTATWRNGVGGIDHHHRPDWFTPMIVVQESRASGQGPNLLSIRDGQPCTWAWWVNTLPNENYLERLHALETAEARAIHEAYPRHEGHDYFWYCEQRGITPYRTLAERQALFVVQFGAQRTPEPYLEPEQVDAILEEQAIAEAFDEAAEPLPVAQWLPGDVLERITTRCQALRANVSAVEIGQHCVFARLLPTGVRLQDANGVEIDYIFSTSKWRWVSRPGVSAPAPAGDLSAVPASEWQVGDTLRRVNINPMHEYSYLLGIGEEVTVREGDRYCPGIEGEFVRVHGTREYRGNSRLLISDFQLVRRAGTPAPAPADGLPPRTQLGARVLVHYPGDHTHGMAGSITSNQNSGTAYRVFVDGVSCSREYAPACLRPLLTEPVLPALSLPAGRSLWLSVDGATLADIRAFEAALVRRGLRSAVDSGHGYGSAADGPRQHQTTGRRPGVVVTKTEFFYYHQDTAYTRGHLLRDWNRVLGLHQAAPAAAPVKQHALAQLPHAFVLEQNTERINTQQEREAALAGYGFRGFVGQYTLFTGNQAVGTSLKGVAEAFLAKHRCPWLLTSEDSFALSTLFRNRQAMLTTSAAQQRFAVDVTASGPHLMTAFRAFMNAIGYRQEKAEKNEGPYVLLNGGNIYAGQPATWQYSEVKNNRNALLNLSEPAQAADGALMSGKSGWDKLGERLANRGVALPVLDAEYLDRSPVVGDKVCLVFNDVREDLPETETVLRSHSCGTTYSVTHLIGGLCLLKETGMLLHPERLQVLEILRGLQNGDQVVMLTAYGEYLKANDVLTLMGGTLVDERQTAYAVPRAHYAPLTDERLTASLLRRYGITLPCVVKITSPDLLHTGDEVILTTAWPLNNQELAFWTESTADQDAWLERKDFQVVVADPAPGLFGTWKLLKGATRETTALQVGELQISLAQLEEALAA